MKMKIHREIHRGLESFIPFPRQIKKDLLSGRLTLSEYHVYVYIRLSGDPYGVATISLDNINNDVFHGKKERNTINAIVLSLRNKRYIYYLPRPGRRGSFEVHLGDWVLPNRGIKQLDGSPRGYSIRPFIERSPLAESEPPPENTVGNQRTDTVNKRLDNGVNGVSEDTQIRGSYTDTYNYKDNDKYNRIGKTTQQILVNGFEPVNHDQNRCYEIAKEVGMVGMGELLHYLKSHGLNVIEDTYTSYREALQTTNGAHIDSPEKYFMAILRDKAKKRSENMDETKVI